MQSSQDGAQLTGTSSALTAPIATAAPSGESSTSATIINTAVGEPDQTAPSVSTAQPAAQRTEPPATLAASSMPMSQVKNDALPSAPSSMSVAATSPTTQEAASAAASSAAGSSTLSAAPTASSAPLSTINTNDSATASATTLAAALQADAPATAPATAVPALAAAAPATAPAAAALPAPAAPAAATSVTAPAAVAPAPAPAPAPVAPISGGTFAQSSPAQTQQQQDSALSHLSRDAVHLAKTVLHASSRVVQGAKASLARPIMSGSMSAAHGKVQLLGQWKMQETDTVSSAFEYTSDHAAPPSWPPSLSGSSWLSVSGFFRIALTEPTGAGSMTVPEKESVLCVGGDVPVDAPAVPAGLAAVGLRGSGKNRYGDFQLRGWFAPSNSSVKMLRIYTTNKPSKRAPTPHKNKTPAKRRGELSAALPRTQRRRSAPKRLAEVGFTGEMTAELRACYNMLESMMKAKAAMFFNDPVDPEALKLPDYFDIVKQPMDYSTIKDKIKRGEYSEPQDFERDMLLVYSNAILYNPVGDPVRAAAEKEREVFRAKMQDLQEQWAEKARKAKAALEAKAKKRDRSFDESDDAGLYGDAKKPRGQLSLPASMAFPASHGGAFSHQPGAAPAASTNQQSHPLASVMAAAGSSGMDPNSVAAMMQVLQAMNGGGVDPGALMQALQAQHGVRGAAPAGAAAAPAHPPAPAAHSSMHAGGSAPLTLREKQELANDVSRLTDAQMDHVVRIVRERMHIPANQTDIELDVDNMDTGTLRALQQYVASCLGRSTPAEKKKPTKRKPRATPAAKPKPAKRKSKDGAGYGASIPPPRAASTAPPAVLPNVSNSLSSLQSQLGIGSAPTLPSGQPSALGGGLAAAMDDALEAPVSSAAATSTVPAGMARAPAAVAEPDEAEDFNFDVSGWEDASGAPAAAAGAAPASSADATKLTSALDGSTAAPSGFEDDWGM